MNLVQELCRLLFWSSPDHLIGMLWVWKYRHKLKSHLWIKGLRFRCRLKKQSCWWILCVGNVDDLLQKKRSHTTVVILRENPERCQKPRSNYQTKRAAETRRRYLPMRLSFHELLSLVVVLLKECIPDLKICVFKPLFNLVVSISKLVLVSTLFKCVSPPIMETMYAFGLWYQPSRMTNYPWRFAGITCQGCYVLLMRTIAAT